MDLRFVLLKEREEDIGIGGKSNGRECNQGLKRYK